ncbi:ABC transporter substrate-binding protein [Rhodoplanes sp. Z2-YC6860]|uniref:ABC transporter substrate-binding protein n=1 Tax=Rhodoplanes sp. Z2-YC6860 TaxID=674703 RepID=UPI00078D811E|nr:ABC transporter substrate-binding protein [Rhodoplanes sp. Z2-YC6860]AMN40620.1 ABC transporter substrate-binding protein [Rhodoplanes sp. Z2-YC6860]
MTFQLRLLLAALLLFASTGAQAADRIRIAAQRTGTLAWELDVIKSQGLDRKADLDLEITELASTEAGKIALKGGSADLILSDWLWVARERGLGGTLTFHPYSSTVGAVMVPAASPIQSIADLKGKKLAVAGGPIDKSWLLLQALARRSGLDLKKDATLIYGTPPLLTQKAIQGEQDATLTFWNFCAELESKGFRRAIAMDDVMKQFGAKGAISIVGYVFDETWAARNRGTIDRFLQVTHEAKTILASSDAEWQRLAPRIGTSDAATLAIYRKRYLEGIPQRTASEEASDAAALYLVLAEIGGADLVGPAKALDPGTFYRPNGGE